MPARPRDRVRKLALRAKVAAEYELAARSRRALVDEQTVLYESFSGNGMLCNPEAIFRELLAADDMGHLRHVWALADLEESAQTVAEFAGNPRVSFVKHKSQAYFAAIATAKYLVNNATFPPQFGKREGQIYLNTWHGTPLKAMGYDVPSGAMDTGNVVRNFLSADYLLAPNEDTAEMYLSAYRMRNIFRGRLVAEGTPRVDKQFASGAERERVRSELRAHGVVLGDSQEIILYAPTWKGSFYSPTNDIRQVRARVEAVAAQIDASKYRLLLKVHQQVHKHARTDAELRDFLVPNDVPTNEVLGVTDVLVTDYSSVFIDFLATGRPVLFYTPDLDDYGSSRGLYLPSEEWPGPVCRDLDELVGRIKQLGSNGAEDPAVSHADAYAAARERYCTREDGAAAARVVDVVFRGKTDGYDVRHDFSDGRTSLLIHLGGMLPNGITSSALSLLDNIDHDRFDVSVTFPHTTVKDRLRLVGLIHPRVRLFPRFGGINGSKLQVTSLVAVKRRTPEQHRKSLARHGDLMRDEWVRCFGESEFDHVVDFSGYAPFWAKLLSSRPSGSFSIWLHNDMRAEATNAGRSDYLRASVAGVSGLYGGADHLVSVSSALFEVNKKGLAETAPADRFTYARNTINFDRIRHLAYGVPSEHGPELVVPAQGGIDSAVPPVSDPLEPPPADLMTSVDSLVTHHGLGNVRDEVERRATVAILLPPAPGVRTFVTAGRLSPEKNHERLVRAFDVIHQEDPATRLVILGGGPLLARLAELVDELGLTSAVTLAGRQPNPYAVLANSDCFVLSSDYEGQPMVLLEAMILGLPIVTTAFGSVRGAVSEGSGLIVARKVEALAEGMRAFLRGEVPTRVFDYVTYNQEATDEFYRAIGAAG